MFAPHADTTVVNDWLGAANIFPAVSQLAPGSPVDVARGGDLTAALS